jgi:hypothetical protein
MIDSMQPVFGLLATELHVCDFSMIRGRDQVSHYPESNAMWLIIESRILMMHII